MKKVKLKLLIVCIVVGCLATGSQALASPYFSIETEEEWQSSLYSTQKGARSIRPMTSSQWEEYMNQWEAYFEGEAYDPPPTTTFIPPELYVYGGGEGDAGEPCDPGLVMAWGSEAMGSGEYASAWMFDYGLDPDLTNSTITITVTAPNDPNIITVSLGMQDINGNIRAWHWNVPATIPWNTPTVVTIDTSLLGVAAATPVADGYMNNPLFDITKVQFLLVDENCNWVGGATPVPPPGQTILRPWNYWKNLSVTPNPGGGPIIAGINIDVHQDVNLVGVDINDFHIKGRIESGDPCGVPGGGDWSSPPRLISSVNDVFTDFNISITPDLTDPAENWFIVEAEWWTDTSIPYCTIIHLGLEFEATCHNVIIDVNGWWTSNGLPVPPGQQPGSRNNGFVPIPGFRVTDNIPGLPSDIATQVIRLQNGNGNTLEEQGEIQIEILSMSLVGLSPIEVKTHLGSYPFGELRLGGLESTLPWINVTTGPIRLEADDVCDIDLKTDLVAPIILKAGDFLIARELIQFQNNSGLTDQRWVWEIHEAHEGESDLGDAPDSTNSFPGTAMTAYPWGVPADYPTVFLAGSPPQGPIHLSPTTIAYLGQAVTQEWEADIGVDQDPTNNILPPTNQSDLDFADDGLLNLPLNLPNCTLTTFKYLVNVITPGTNLYFNAWADWNRDGDWNDSLTCSSGPAPEWIVQNQSLGAALPAGLNTLTTPQFLPWHSSTTAEPIWLRITLSEQTLSSSGGGAGPATGYAIGETEDYYFTPQITGCSSADNNLSGIVDWVDMTWFANQWLTTTVP